MSAGGLASGWFCLESSLITLAISATAFSFYRDRTMQKAKKMFHASLLYLPVFMSGLLFHRITNNDNDLTQNNSEEMNQLTLPLQGLVDNDDEPSSRKIGANQTSVETQPRPPVAYASYAPFPFLPVPSYAAPR